MIKEEHTTARPSPGPRLSALAKLCHQGERLIDVGCDHALLPLYLLETGAYTEALAIDVNQGPLDLARQRIAADLKIGSLSRETADRLSFLRQDGLTDIELNANTCVVIAGIGGLEIHKILEQGAGQDLSSTRFVLSPQRSYAELNYYLLCMGAILHHELVSQDDFTYLLIKTEGIPGDPHTTSILPGDMINIIYGFNADASTLSEETQTTFRNRQRRQLMYDLLQARAHSRTTNAEDRSIYPAKASLHHYLSDPLIQRAAIEEGHVNEDLRIIETD